MIRTVAALCAALAATTAAAAEDWDFTVSLYGWLPAMEVDASIDRPGGEVSSEVSTSAFEIFDALNFGVFGTAEARRGRLGLFGDVFYTDLGVSETGPLGEQLSVGSNLFMFTGAAGWRLWEGGGAFLDGYGGGRIVSLDSKVTNGSRTASKSTSYVDPMIGARVGYAATERTSLMAHANIGGFGAGSEFTWEAYAGANYAFTERVSGELGYRYLSIDYEEDGKEIDMQLFGPFTALVLRF
jgi:opacity protein-like surface antigen